MTWTLLLEEELEGDFIRLVHAYQVDAAGCLVMTTVTSKFVVPATDEEKDIPIAVTTQWAPGVQISGSDLVAIPAPPP